jgi:C4-dicarboxylate transporter DctM subunit
MAIVGRVKGGLAMVVVVAEVLFSGISGSTAADVSAISSLLVPSMRKAGYSGGEAVSVYAAGGRGQNGPRGRHSGAPPDAPSPARPALLLFGGIFTGITTVTEAALVAVVYALVVGMAAGGISRANLVHLFERSGVVTATTLWVLAAASAFAWILVREWVPQTLGEWITGVGASRAVFLGLTLFVFVVIGALLEGLPAL